MPHSWSSLSVHLYRHCWSIPNSYSEGHKHSLTHNFSTVGSANRTIGELAEAMRKFSQMAQQILSRQMCWSWQIKTSLLMIPDAYRSTKHASTNNWKRKSKLCSNKTFLKMLISNLHSQTEEILKNLLSEQWLSILIIFLLFSVVNIVCIATNWCGG